MRSVIVFAVFALALGVLVPSYLTRRDAHPRGRAGASSIGGAAGRARRERGYGLARDNRAARRARGIFWLRRGSMAA